MEIFQLLNPDEQLNKHEIDLHWQTKDAARQIVKRKVEELTDEMAKGALVSNLGDGRNHVFKIICGAGTHSKDGPVLMRAIPELICELGLEYYSIP